MTNWNTQKLRIKDLLTDDDSNEGAILTGEQVSKRITQFHKNLPSPKFAGGDELIEIAGLFEYITGNKELYISPLEDFNMQLDRLYDWADENKFWIE